MACRAFNKIIFFQTGRINDDRGGAGFNGTPTRVGVFVKVSKHKEMLELDVKFFTADRANSKIIGLDITAILRTFEKLDITRSDMGSDIIFQTGLTVFVITRTIRAHLSDRKFFPANLTITPFNGIVDGLIFVIMIADVHERIVVRIDLQSDTELT